MTSAHEQYACRHFLKYTPNNCTHAFISNYDFACSYEKFASAHKVPSKMYNLLTVFYCFGTHIRGQSVGSLLHLQIVGTTERILINRHSFFGYKPPPDISLASILMHMHTYCDSRPCNSSSRSFSLSLPPVYHLLLFPFNLLFCLPTNQSTLLSFLFFRISDSHDYNNYVLTVTNLTIVIGLILHMIILHLTLPT